MLQVKDDHIHQADIRERFYNIPVVEKMIAARGSYFLLAKFFDTHCLISLRKWCLQQDAIVRGQNTEVARNILVVYIHKWFGGINGTNSTHYRFKECAPPHLKSLIVLTFCNTGFCLVPQFYAISFYEKQVTSRPPPFYYYAAIYSKKYIAERIALLFWQRTRIGIKGDRGSTIRDGDISR